MKPADTVEIKIAPVVFVIAPGRLARSLGGGLIPFTLFRHFKTKSVAVEDRLGFPFGKDKFCVSQFVDTAVNSMGSVVFILTVSIIAKTSDCGGGIGNTAGRQQGIDDEQNNQRQGNSRTQYQVQSF